MEGRKPAPLSTAKAARPVGTRRGKQKRTQPQLRSASSLRGRTGVALARASPTALLSGCYSAPKLFMISAPMSLDTPKASLCSVYQGSSPGDEQKEGSPGWKRPRVHRFQGSCLCHPPPMETGGLGLPSLIGTPHPSTAARAQSTVTELVGRDDCWPTASQPAPSAPGRWAAAEEKWGLQVCRPCFPKSPHSRLQSCPVPHGRQGMRGSLRMGGVCREPCRHSVSPNSSLRARGSKLPAPPTLYLG